MLLELKRTTNILYGLIESLKYFPFYPIIYLILALQTFQDIYY